MFSLNRISLCMLLLATTSTLAEDSNMDNDTLSLISLYNFSSNSLRTGFEPFYLFTNLFIDNLFEPHIPQQIKQAANTSWSQFTEQLVSNYGLKDGWFQDLKFVSIIQPGLVNFIIISIFISILIPIVGFCICSYRTCCRPKFSPFDRKYDTYKRKLYSVILFILLVASLIGSVILFFTGQNSLLAFKNFPKILNSSAGQIDDFSREDIPQFFVQTNKLIDQINSESIKIFDSTLEQTLDTSLESLTQNPFFEKYNNDLAPRLNKLHSLYLNITMTSSGLNKTSFSNASTKNIEIFNKFNNIDEIKSSLKKNFNFLNQIKSENFDLNSLLPLMNQKLDKIQTEFSQNVNEFLSKIKNQIRGFNNYIELELAFFSSKINSKNNNTFLNQLVHIYQIFYYILLGVSVFVLSLFILHSLGLAGICSRRMHNNFRQSCHRGISANFFLAGTAFYFLFAFFIIVLCVIMFLPGITFRQFVCRPAVDFENNQVFQTGAQLANFDKLLENSSVSQIVFECDKKNSSLFLNSKMKLLLDDKIGTSISNLIEKFRPEMSKIDLDSVSNSMKNLKIFIDNVLDELNDQEKTSTLEKIDNFLSLNRSLDLNSNFLEEEVLTEINLEMQNLEKFKQLITDPKIKEVLSTLSDLAKKVQDKLNDEKTSEKFQNSLANILNSFTLPKVEQLKNAKIEELVDALPSCRILSNLYQSLTLSVCYEFIDNFNTFWSTLYILTILFFVICCFAFVQADLMRKFYRYDELLDEDVGDEKSSTQFDMQRQRSSRANSGAIDAYEMKGYNSSGMKYPSNRSSPSTRNTRA